MCGIIGVLNLTNPSPIDPDRLSAGNRSLYHRGPDDEGMFVQPEFGMAMRRLSIIDVAHGHQPMSNEDGTVHIVYNGEVYNHNELRRELESLGHRFRTNADTEVVLHGYEQWGRDALLEKLRGMFAFAVWNSRERTLFLARDRMGIKPLYYAEHDGRLYFASEIRGILHLSDVPRRTHLPALHVFMKLGFVSSPHTMFEGVRRVPPAHYVWVKDGAVSSRPYWELSYEVTHRGSEADIVAEFRERLRDCVVRHMMSEVPLGALLSGGVDSTATVAFMRSATKDPFKTVTIGFDGDFDEMEWAAASARELGTDHHSIRFTGDSMDAFPAVLRYLEEPIPPVEIALYHLFKACRERGLKVVMTGEGADELLGGYSWHKSGWVDRALSRLPFSMRTALGGNPALRTLGQSARNVVRVARGVPTETHRRYQTTLAVKSPELTSALFSAQMRSSGEDASQSILDSWADWMPCVEGRSDFEQLLWIQSRTRMPDFIILGLDRMSMAHSIEARPPFLDHTLWEFCASIPTALKMKNATEKYLLREAGKGLIPEAARVRPKLPLGVPFARWLRKPRLPDWAETALGEAQVREAGLFDPAAVSDLRRGVVAGEMVKSRTLMNVLTMQVWAREFLESPVSSSTFAP